MPTYKLRFFIETPLVSQTDITVKYRSTNIQFLFSERKDNAEGVEAELCVEANNHLDAIEYAQSHILHAVLDAIAFQRHTHLSVRNWTRILKAERGRRRRKFILASDNKNKDKCFIDRESVSEVQKILDGSMMLSLRWMRNSYRHSPIFDKFIFLWLALEDLSGTAKKQTRCPKCQQPAICEKCKTHPEHNASDRKTALKIIQSFDKETNEKTFNLWWNDLRNKVFHGSGEPTIELISKLNSANEKIAPALDAHLKTLLGVELRYRTKEPIGPDFTVRMFSYVEFDSDDPDQDFPTELPNFAQIQDLSQENPEGTKLLSAQEFVDW